MSKISRYLHSFYRDPMQLEPGGSPRTESTSEDMIVGQVGERPTHPVKILFANCMSLVADARTATR